MSESERAHPRSIRNQLRDCQRSLKEAEEINRRLRALLGGDLLGDWKPQKRIERQYGWVFAWLYPLRSFMNQHLNESLTPDLRNKIYELVAAIICQLAVFGKYGIRLPFDPMPVDSDRFSRRQIQISEEDHDPCDICGEDRITHDCHIVPRAEGGEYHRDNLVVLCPLHHHLFDHSRLSEDEWNKLFAIIMTKSPSAKTYAMQVRFPAHRQFWSRET